MNNNKNNDDNAIVKPDTSADDAAAEAVARALSLSNSISFYLLFLISNDLHLRRVPPPVVPPLWLVQSLTASRSLKSSVRALTVGIGGGGRRGGRRPRGRFPYMAASPGRRRRPIRSRPDPYADKIRRRRSRTFAKTSM